MIAYPQVRMRRRRMNQSLRRLSRETLLAPSHLIWSVFIIDGLDNQEAVPSMPGVYRYTIDRLITLGKEAQQLGIQAMALFPVVPTDKKDEKGSEALNANNLVCCALTRLKQEVPNMLLLADVALDPYTLHGQDGLINDSGIVVNDASVEILCQQSILQAQAGADIVAPSDMMDGRVGSIRRALDDVGLQDKLIAAYTAKYASAYYAPFRDAIGSKNNLGQANKKNYQMDPSNAREALLEADLDIAEGADFMMVKPGLPYLDIIRRLSERHMVPIWAYQVSGEYACIQASAQHGWLDGDAVMMETLLCFRRAGAQAILTYAALDTARQLYQR